MTINSHEDFLRKYFPMAYDEAISGMTPRDLGELMANVSVERVIKRRLG